MVQLPDARFGGAGAKLPNWRLVPDDDLDDEEGDTPEDVVEMLGFDPKHASDTPGGDNAGIPAALVTAMEFALDEGSVRSTDEDGRLRVAEANISKANVCPYRGSEIPGAEELGLDPDKVYQLYRDPQELERAAPTFRNVQILRRHVPVSADDPRQWDVVGTVGSNVWFEEPYLKADLMFWTADAIAEVESGERRQLSSGYRYAPDMVPGVSPTGERYDGTMRSISGNHIIFCAEGRAGPDVAVGDSADELRWLYLESAITAMTHEQADRRAA